MNVAPLLWIFLALAVGAFVVCAPIIVWMKRRSAKILQALREELAASNETVVRAPESALYCGATATYGQVNGNGWMALTSRRLLFRKLVGGPVELPVEGIVALREAKWFRSTYRTGRLHLIVQVGDAEIGFLVQHHAAWMNALRAVAPIRP